MKNIGERIRVHRERCGLSQLEFSERLDVSRQAVSKWETGTAMPELVKLIKMAEIFGISLDLLILGKEEMSGAHEALGTPDAAAQMPDGEKPAAKNVPVRETSLVKLVMGCFFLVVGAILSVFFLFWAPLLGLALLVPFGLCALFCLKQFRRAGLWCAETWFLFAAAYLCYGSGTRWGLILHPMLYSEHTNEWLIILSWLEFALLILLIGLTVYAFRDHVFSFSRGKHIALAALGVAVLTLRALFPSAFSLFCFYVLCGGNATQYGHFLSHMGDAMSLIELALDAICAAVFTACLVPTVFWIKRSRKPMLDGASNK